MESEASLERLQLFIKENILPILIGFIGIAFLLFGTIVWTSNSSNDEIVFEEGQSLENDQEAAEEKIVVDIAGAVQKPGVYSLSSQARLQDLFIAAGGLSNEADRAYVAKSINLAAKLSDGTKIYIPFTGEQVPSVLGAESQTGKININTAPESQLDTLTGVGPATITKIVVNRPYTKLEELVDKKVLSQSIFEKIKDQITLY
ncbi:MAG TPA: ComEA family DNA-binding protein [Patescibacteria group bacterium]|nr:ComEA family DNA-binding protein [Patescibacteria group bacterium]